MARGGPMGKLLLICVLVLPVVCAACGGGSVSDTRSIPMDTGATTTSTVPASVPALESGITTEQVKQLISSYAGIALENFTVTDHATFGNWAAAKISDQQGASGWVFQKLAGAWLLMGSADSTYLSYIGAPVEVRSFFGF